MSRCGCKQGRPESSGRRPVLIGFENNSLHKLIKRRSRHLKTLIYNVTNDNIDTILAAFRVKQFMRVPCEPILVVQVLGKMNQPQHSLGILESFNVATLIQGADAAAKAASVQLLEIRLAMALGGKAFVTMTGDVGSVQSAMAAGRQVIGDAGVLVNAVILSRPHPDVYREVI